MKIKVAGIIILCVILLNGCTGSAYLNNSTEKADIQLKDDTFDITVEDCIRVLNEDIKKENLELIPVEYETVEFHDRTDYRCMINNILMIRFVTYKKHGPGIVRIALSRIDSIAYKKGNMKFNYEATKQDRKAAETYYEIICNNVQPRFNADQFVKSTEGDTSDMDLDLGGMVFFGNMPGVDSLYGNEEVEIYEVFSSDKLYEMYREDLYDEDDMFLYHRE